jgi:6-phosphofructokinase 1
MPCTPARTELRSWTCRSCVCPRRSTTTSRASELSIGADTALNSIIDNLDKIKESAVSTHRCFVVETMGRDCGYLALMSGLATGAERLYLPEEGMHLDDLAEDVEVAAQGLRRRASVSGW